ncbi:MAG: heavy-metal-associated domain-containing protein [Thermoplasmata archaeon]
MSLLKKRGEAEVRLRVEGMSCGHCAARVTAALENLKGIREVKVNLLEKEAVVKIRPGAVTRPELIQAVERVGYKAA